MPDKIPDPGSQHPSELRRDLNPDAMAGQNLGVAAPQPEKDGPTLYDLKEAHRRFRAYSDDELKQVPVVAVGGRLKQGATYIDLREDPPREFTATAEMEATEDNWYVFKPTVDYQLWNRLIGVSNPERLGRASER